MYTYAVCVESRGQPWIPFLWSHALLLETGLLSGPRLAAPAKSPGDSKYTLPHQGLHMRAELRSTLYTLHTANTNTVHYLLRPPNTTLRRFYTAGSQ